MKYYFVHAFQHAQREPTGARAPRVIVLKFGPFEIRKMAEKCLVALATRNDVWRVELVESTNGQHAN